MGPGIARPHRASAGMGVVHVRLRSAAALCLLLVGWPAVVGHAAASNIASVSVFPAPTGMSDVAGEPSIGVDHRTGAVLFQSGYRTYRVTLDATGGAAWRDVTSPQVATFGGDPVLWVDPDTGRAIESQEFFTCSGALISDDDGTTWTPSEGCGAGVFADHQSLASGPYPTALLPAAAIYPRAFYYCGQDGGFTGGTAYCARSDDGGRTFGVGSPIYNVPSADSTAPRCTSLHGKLRVAPDGTVYVPNKDCSGRVAVTASGDGGVTWIVRPIPGSTTQDESDPAVAIGARGTVYVGWQQGANNAIGSQAYVASSVDQGRTWSRPIDLSSALGVRNIQFPQAVAGDDERAAVAFLGTSAAGDDQRGNTKPDATPSQQFSGVWHLYIATTADRGGHWNVIDATPLDPVQRGCISLGGLLASGCRNLLDFNDITSDASGHVLVAFADGCTGKCAAHPLAADASYSRNPGYRTRHGTIARLNGFTLHRGR